MISCDSTTHFSDRSCFTFTALNNTEYTYSVYSIWPVGFFITSLMALHFTRISFLFPSRFCTFAVGTLYVWWNLSQISNIAKFLSKSFFSSPVNVYIWNVVIFLQMTTLSALSRYNVDGKLYVKYSDWIIACLKSPSR